MRVHHATSRFRVLHQLNFSPFARDGEVCVEKDCKGKIVPRDGEAPPTEPSFVRLCAGICSCVEASERAEGDRSARDRALIAAADASYSCDTQSLVQLL